jgi:hypothetical protein
MKVKDLIKELTNCGMEDQINVSIMSNPNGEHYTAKFDAENIYIGEGAPCILLNPTSFHLKQDKDQNPIETTLKNTLCGIMVEPTDDGSYKDMCEEFEAGNYMEEGK